MAHSVRVLKKKLEAAGCRVGAMVTRLSVLSLEVLVQQRSTYIGSQLLNLLSIPCFWNLKSIFYN